MVVGLPYASPFKNCSSDLVKVWIGIASIRAAISLKSGSAPTGKTQALIIAMPAVTVKCFILFLPAKFGCVASVIALTEGYGHDRNGCGRLPHPMLNCRISNQTE